MGWTLALALLPLVVAAAAAGLWFRHSMRATGWKQWSTTARDLSWEDRRRVWRATARGESVADERLAALVVERSERVLALMRHLLRRSTLLWFFGVASVLLLVALVLSAIAGQWLLVGLLIAIVVAPVVNLVLLERRLLPRVERTIQANRR